MLPDYPVASGGGGSRMLTKVEIIFVPLLSCWTTSGSRVPSYVSGSTHVSERNTFHSEVCAGSCCFNIRVVCCAREKQDANNKKGFASKSRPNK